MGTHLVDRPAWAWGVIIFGVIATAAGVTFLFTHEYMGGTLSLLIGLSNLAQGILRRRAQQHQADAAVRGSGDGSKPSTFDRPRSGL